MGVLAEGLNLTASEGPTVPLEWQRDYLVEHHERLLQHWVTKIYFPVAITASVTGTFGNLLIITSILYAKVARLTLAGLGGDRGGGGGVMPLPFLYGYLAILKGIYPEFQVIRGFSQKIPAGLLSYDQIHS